MALAPRPRRRPQKPKWVTHTEAGADLDPELIEPAPLLFAAKPMPSVAYHSQGEEQPHSNSAAARGLRPNSLKGCAVLPV